MLELHSDSDALIEGTHDGADGSLTLQDLNLDFRACGAYADLAIHNDTQVTDGTITSVTKHTIVSDVSFDNGDEYSIYKTATKDSFISRIGIDRSRGWKETDKANLTSYGWRPEDVDIDVDEDGNRLPQGEIPFGPGQPFKRRK